MLKRVIVTLLCAVGAVAALTSCGDSKAAGTGQFATVFATATAPVGPLDADVSTWVDATTGNPPALACAAGSVPTVTPTDAIYTITSTPYAVPNTGQSSTITASPLAISNITLRLTPANTSTPALPPAFQTQPLSSGRTIASGANSFTIRLASNELKSFLSAQALNCSNVGLTYSYRATVSFEALEVTTNRVATITAPGFLLVNFSDFID